jgi:5'-nucleotidase
VIGLMGGLPECAPPLDAIVSGINRGANLGTDILYSGTAAAARQGALCNIPSLALSLVEGDAWYWDMAVAFAAERFAEMLAFWKPDCFVNVNIPSQKETPRGLVHAFPSLRYYNDSIEAYYAPDGHRYCFVKAGEVSVKPEKGSDWEAVAGSNASISDILIHPALLGRYNVGEQVRMER